MLLRIISSASESEQMAEKTTLNHGVYVVPSFTGLGAPHWQPDARAAIWGLTRNSSVEDIVAASLQSVGFQTLELIEAMQSDGIDCSELKVDGGMAVNNWTMQFLADITKLEITQPVIYETTALGAAYLAGLKAGLFNSLEEISELWQSNLTFKPSIDNNIRRQLISGWQDAVERVKQ